MTLWSPLSVGNCRWEVLGENTMNREQSTRDRGSQPENDGGQRGIDIKRLEQRLERVERALDGIEDGLDWSLCGRCAECDDGWLIRERAVIQCTSCSYRVE